MTKYCCWKSKLQNFKLGNEMTCLSISGVAMQLNTKHQGWWHLPLGTLASGFMSFERNLSISKFLCFMWFCLNEYFYGRKGKEEREGCWDSFFAFKTCGLHPFPWWSPIEDSHVRTQLYFKLAIKDKLFSKA